MKQFAELSAALPRSSNEGRRQGGGGTIPMPQVPERWALLIGSMPISIAAAFLARATAISDGVLISIIRHKGGPCERHCPSGEPFAFGDRRARRASSVRSPPRTHSRRPPAPGGERSQTAAAAAERRKAARGNQGAGARRTTGENATPSIQPISELHCRAAVRFARNGEATLFSTAWQTRSEQAAHSPTRYCSMFPASSSPRRLQLSPFRRTRKAACSRRSIPIFPKESAAATAPKR